MLPTYWATFLDNFGLAKQNVLWLIIEKIWRHRQRERQRCHPRSIHWKPWASHLAYDYGNVPVSFRLPVSFETRLWAVAFGGGSTLIVYVWILMCLPQGTFAYPKGSARKATIGSTVATRPFRSSPPREIFTLYLLCSAESHINGGTL